MGLVAAPGTADLEVLDDERDGGTLKFGICCTIDELGEELWSLLVPWILFGSGCLSWFLCWALEWPPNVGNPIVMVWDLD